MNPDTHIQSTNIESAKTQVEESTPESIINAIAIQLDRIDEAKRRIEEEGIVVRDMKGSVIAHPAIKVETDAIKIMTDLLTKHKRIPNAF